MFDETGTIPAACSVRNSESVTKMLQIFKQTYCTTVFVYIYILHTVKLGGTIYEERQKIYY